MAQGLGDRGLVDHQPVKSNLPDGVAEFVEVHRLLDVAVHSEFVSLDEVLLLFGGSQNNDGNGLRLRVILDARL